MRSTQKPEVLETYVAQVNFAVETTTCKEKRSGLMDMLAYTEAHLKKMQRVNAPNQKMT